MNKVVIDVEARFVDNVTDESAAASKSVEGIGKAAEQAQKKVQRLGKTKAQIEFDANNTKLVQKIRKWEAKAQQLGKQKTMVVLDAMDKATVKINKIIGTAKNFAGKTWNAFLKVKDSQATAALGNVIGMGKQLAGKTWTTLVKIKDMATTPLTKIKNTLFSIKSLVAAVTAGFAVKQTILDPINLADAYSGTRIGFSTLLGAERGQQMMNDMDEFAKKTPFKTSGVIDNAQKMMAYGWDAERILTDMETIGNAAAATGKMDEGLASIVYALSEIRSKGKLSTQELNQLASAGIKAKAYLAEGLGYGTDDAGLQKLAEDLEDGAIGANQAIELILEGMKEFDGMMDSMANETVEGLKSQIEDAFEINIARKWGQGLQDGAKRGLGYVVNLLDSAEDSLSAFGDTLYDVGKTLSNWAADKLQTAVKTIQEITASAEFQEAGLWDKVKMLWSGVIGNPFSEWWSNTVIPWWDGTAIPWLSDKAAKAGELMGKGLTNGLLALFGMTDEAIDAAETGASIAGSFVKGFVDGFDGSAIADAFLNALNQAWNALPWWGKLLVGGYGASKVGGLINGGMQLFGNLSTIMGSTGNAMVAGSGLSGAASGLGYAITGGAAGSTLGGGAAALIGGGTALGIGAGVATVGSGIYDIYQGNKNNDETLKKAGKWKVNGALGGAAAGAAIGTALGGPLIGTAVGALVGSGIGWWQSRKIKKAAEENAKALEEQAQAEALAAIEAKRLQEELVQKDLAGRFGDITLSAAEVKAAVDDMFGDDLIAKAHAASDAIAQMEESYSSFLTADSKLKKDLWMTTIRKDSKLSKDEMEGLKNSAKSFSTAAHTYLDDARYASSESITALLGNSEKAEKVLKASTDYYDEQGDALTKKTKELNDKMTKALSDGVISIDEQKSLQKIRSQISNIVAQIQKDEYSADINILKAKYSDPDISHESFQDMMSQAETTANEMAEGYWQQFGQGSKGLKEGSEEWNSLLEGTLKNLGETWLVPGDLGLDKIQTKWKDELGILGQDFSKMLNENTIPEIISASEGVSETARGSISKMLETMSPTTEQIQGVVDRYRELGLEPPKALTEYLNSVEFYEALAKGPEAVKEYFSEIDIDPAIKMVDPKIENLEELDKVFEADINLETEWHYDEFDKEWISPDGQYSFSTDALVKAGWTYNSFEHKWISPDGQYWFHTNANVDTDYNTDKFNSQMIAPASNYSFDTTATVSVKYKIKGSTTPLGNIKMNYASKQAQLMLQQARGGIIDPDGLRGFAAGGMVRGGGQIVKVAEEGTPEMIIPLGSQRRERALKLWAKAGEMMDVPGFARGGTIESDGLHKSFVGNSVRSAGKLIDFSERQTRGKEDEGIRFRGYEDEGTSGGQSVMVDVGGVQVQIQVDATNNANIVEAIKAQAGEIAETVAGVLADAFTGQFENTPTKGGAA